MMEKKSGKDIDKMSAREYDKYTSDLMKAQKGKRQPAIKPAKYTPGDLKKKK